MRNLLDSYPDFYKNSPEFQALMYVLTCEILNLWYGYELFLEHVVLNGDNPAVFYKNNDSDAEGVS